MRKILSEIYYDISHPAGYSSMKKLYKAAKKILPSITLNQVKVWLRHQETYMRHRKVIRKFRRRKTIARGIDSIWQIDLCDLSKLSVFNRGYKFLLTVIDVFSRYAFVRPLKNKTGLEVSKAIEHIFETEKRKPNSLSSDLGTEFYNANVNLILEKRNIKLFSIHGEPKMALVERFNRTLKTKMWKYFTSHNTKKYINVLPNLVSSYNNSRHRIIGMAPSQVNEKIEKQLWIKLYRKEFLKSIKYRFNVGDYVKIRKIKKTFEKGYVANWTTDVYIVQKRYGTNPVTYKLKDINNEDVDGSFYEKQMQLVSKPKPDITKQIDILRSRSHNGKTQYYIHYKDWNSRFDQWIDKDQLITI